MQLHQFAQGLLEIIRLQEAQGLDVGHDGFAVLGKLVLFHHERVLGTGLDGGQIDELHEVFAGRQETVAIEQQTAFDKVDGFLFGQGAGGVDGEGDGLDIDVTDDFFARPLFIL